MFKAAIHRLQTPPFRRCDIAGMSPSMTTPDVPDHPFTADEAYTMGFTPTTLRWLARCGEIRHLLYGVYVPGSWPDDVGSRAAAAAHVMPRHAVVTDRSAASLFGIDVHDYAEIPEVPSLEMVSINGAQPSRRTGIRGGKRDLLPDEIMDLHGVLVTVPARTACDIACMLGRHRAIATLDAFRTKLDLTQHDFSRLLPRFVGRRGVIQLRELIPLSRTGVDSQPESWIRIDLHDAGYPMPEPQLRTFVPGWGMVRIENAYPELRMAVEYDGEEHHSEDEDREHDHQRREAARAAAGWHIVVVRRDGFSRRGNERWLSEFARIWAERAPGPAGKRRYARAQLSGRPSLRRRGSRRR